MKRPYFVACLLVLLLPGRAGAQTPSLEGHWSGALSRDGSLQRLTFDIRSEGNALRAMVTLPYRGDLTFPISLQYDAPLLTFRLGRDSASVRVDLDAGNMRGFLFTNDGLPTKLFVQRTLRPAQPEIYEEEITFEAGEVTLAGTLLRPAGSGPHPVIIYVTGRSNGTRLQHLGDASLLARRGVAGLVFDSRGTGQSGGDRATLTDTDRFTDVLAAIDFVSARSDLDAEQIGLYANSAGGWVVPVVAQRSDRVAFLVLNVGPAESLADQQGHVIEALMRRSDRAFIEADYEAACAYQKRLVELSHEGADWATFAPLVAKAKKQPWADFVDLPEDLNNAELDYFRRRPGFDPVPYLKQTTLPVLALYGEEDVVVPPEENVPKLRQYLTEAGNEDFDIVVFADAGHSMLVGGAMRGEGDWPGAYYQWTTAPPGYYETLVGWVLDHVKRVP